MNSVLNILYFLWVEFYTEAQHLLIRRTALQQTLLLQHRFLEPFRLNLGRPRPLFPAIDSLRDFVRILSCDIPILCDRTIRLSSVLQFIKSHFFSYVLISYRVSSGFTCMLFNSLILLSESCSSHSLSWLWVWSVHRNNSLREVWDTAVLNMYTVQYNVDLHPFVNQFFFILGGPERGPILKKVNDFSLRMLQYLSFT